jgi:predicted small secreted protein
MMRRTLAVVSALVWVVVVVVGDDDDDDDEAGGGRRDGDGDGHEGEHENGLDGAGLVVGARLAAARVAAKAGLLSGCSIVGGQGEDVEVMMLGGTQNHQVLAPKESF